ncbi:LTA synthase family protein [Mongoliibacter ruber]|uniref:Putative sulfatase n=1 Tax=Mongoliibacter ruber TaxID=1750599 RepID=A0A2T0WWB4_9BACT|nr:alkaline phosphatase family protein [Mongoliibacter ruber]PRY90978.1 putative sulfatase [Mongoliibacter ruber]
MSQHTPISSNLLENIQKGFVKFWKLGLSFIILIILLRLVEVWTVFSIHDLDKSQTYIFAQGLVFDIAWAFYILGLLFFFHLITHIYFPRFANVFVQVCLTVLILLQAGLFFYFTKMLLPLGQDLYAYSPSDIISTLKASGELNVKNIIFILIGLPIAYLITGFGKWFPVSLKVAQVFAITCYLYILVFYILGFDQKKYSSELDNYLLVNKSYYFYDQSYDYFTTQNYLYFDFFLADKGSEQLLMKKQFLDANYPFLHDNDYPDVLGPFFEEFDEKPDVVFVIIEGMGKAYSGEDAYLRSFTPFLDSLSEHSLYWKNGMSTTGRTFGVLTGIFGSLPYARNGFMELAPNLPKHLTFLSLMKQNGYFTNYHIGADKNFDNVGTFLSYQKVDRILDLSSFDPDFEETPSKSGFSWGYPDKAMFENGMRKIPRDLDQPQVSIFQTQTSHDPFIIPDEEKYFSMLAKYMAETLKIPANQVENYMKYRSMYASLLYVDEAIKEFFDAYKSMPKYENTIFILTGDHRLPEVPMSSTIDRFHVPIIIYSPKLKESRRFHGVTTHFEITPSLLAMLANRQEMKLPSMVSWKGYVMDTSAVFQSKISNPLMRNKNQLIDYISEEYVLSDDQLYKLSDNMNLDPIYDNAIKDKLKAEFENYKSSNRYATENDQIIPDSLRVYLPN